MIKKLRKNRGFTLIELMIVVAIVGILAVLAIFGVSKYLANAKSAEATNTIGKINERAVAGYEEENNTAEIALIGSTGQASTHALCGTAGPVPDQIAKVQNKKYQPDPTNLKDYATGSNVGIDTATRFGWKCLKFEMSQPQYYIYGYAIGGNRAVPLVAVNAVPPVGAQGWLSEATGDLDADNIQSVFSTGGQIEPGSKKPVTFTQINVFEAEE